MADEYWFQVRWIEELSHYLACRNGAALPRRRRASQFFRYSWLTRRRGCGLISVVPAVSNLRRYRLQRRPQRDSGEHPFFAFWFFRQFDLMFLGETHVIELDKKIKILGEGTNSRAQRLLSRANKQEQSGEKGIIFWRYLGEKTKRQKGFSFLWEFQFKREFEGDLIW